MRQSAAIVYTLIPTIIFAAVFIFLQLIYEPEALILFIHDEKTYIDWQVVKNRFGFYGRTNIEIHIIYGIVEIYNKQYIDLVYVPLDTPVYYNGIISIKPSYKNMSVEMMDRIIHGVSQIIIIWPMLMSVCYFIIKSCRTRSVNTKKMITELSTPRLTPQPSTRKLEINLDSTI